MVMMHTQLTSAPLPYPIIPYALVRGSKALIIGSKLTNQKRAAVFCCQLFFLLQCPE